MNELQPSNIECFVFTFKEGLLSAVAHDLKLQMTDLSIQVAPDRSKIEARGKAASLQVVCAMADGKERPTVLDAKDKADIEKNIQKDVIKTKKHPEVSFSSTRVSESADGYEIAGSLQVAGRSNSVVWRVTPKGDWWEARLRMHQPDWGIKPFSAMFGTLKIKPDIDLLVRVRKSAVES